MITKFGKFCRKLRIDRGELLYDMASKLDVSTSFLSKVENGKKKPPVEWEQIIISKYGISGKELEDFQEAFFYAVNNDSIDISSMGISDKELMLSFARKFDSLDKIVIRKLLDNKEEE